MASIRRRTYRLLSHMKQKLLFTCRNCYMFMFIDIWINFEMGWNAKRIGDLWNESEHWRHVDRKKEGPACIFVGLPVLCCVSVHFTKMLNAISNRSIQVGITIRAYYVLSTLNQFWAMHFTEKKNGNCIKSVIVLSIVISSLIHFE